MTLMRCCKQMSAGLVVTVCLMQGATSVNAREDDLLEPLREYVREVAASSAEIPDNRRQLLHQAAEAVTSQLKAGDAVSLTFICTHNSRRSHLGQVWAQAAATFYDLPAGRVRTFSGGTETTACNIRTVRALRRAGLSVVNADAGDGNPVYLVQHAEKEPALRAFSKVYNRDGNPTKNFLAMMCCSDADEKCPIVTGATQRFSLHFVDPKEADNTDQEVARYDERCRQIAIEMFYLMSKVNN